jgi:pilus assembly protein Flp/PilA
MKSLLQKLHAKFVCRKGQGLVEYVLIVGLIALVVVAAVTLFGEGVNNVFQNAATKVNGIPTT